MRKKRNLFDTAPPDHRTLDDQAYGILGEMLLERETRRLLAEIEQEEKQIDSARAAERFIPMNRRCIGQIDAYFRKERMKHFFTKALLRGGRVAAMLAVMFAVAGTVALAASETIRVEVMRLIASVSEKYTALKLVEDEEASFDVPADWQGISYPSYIPSGLELLSVDSDAGFSTVDYGSDDSQIALVFQELGESVEMNLDTEDALLTPVSINACSGIMVEKRNKIHIYWCDDQMYYILTTRDMERDTALQIAQSVKKIR